MDPQALNDSFGLPGALHFDEPHPGMTRLLINTPACTAELFLQGAHLTRWQPAGQEPVLFLSTQTAYTPGKAIRGGIPIIFPWFGAAADSPIHPPSAAPQHGFARTSIWTVAFAALSGDEVHLTLTIGPNESTREFGFPDFQLAYELRLGRDLRLRLSVANTGQVPMLFEEALHTYLAVGSAKSVSIDGLGGTSFLDKTENFRRKRQDDPTLTLHGETDRAYLNTAATVSLLDHALNRKLSVAKENSATTVVWNPWSDLAAKMKDLGDNEWQNFTCIETANAADNVVTLRSHEAHTLEARIYVEPLGTEP